MNGFLCAASATIATALAQAQIAVTGIAPRATYADRAVFTIEQASGYNYSAALNGAPLPIGQAVTVTNANYYELQVERSAEGAANVESLTVPFIVTSSERGSSETGLPPWTPLPMVPSAEAEFSGARVEIFAPERYPAGMAPPLVAWIRDENGRRPVNGIVRPENGPELLIRRGVGSVLLTNAPLDGVIDYPLALPGLATNIAVNLETNIAWITNSGTLAGNTTWPANSRIDLDGNLAIPAGITLTIEEGTVVRVAPGVEIFVAGAIQARGQARNPVVFAPASADRPWGGIELRSAAAALDFMGVILTGGGADPNWFDAGGNGSSHRHEQPIIFASNGAQVNLTDSALIYGAGQAGHGENAFFNCTRTLLQGFITAGQYNGGSVRFVDSAAVEFPADDDRFADADNDGFYLTGGAHYLTNSLIGWVKDDGIDAGSGSAGSVTVVHCWIESCYHEGFAWSEERTATVRGTVVLNCGQGIEAGFGTPNVTVVDSLSTANLIGARFGDNYNWGYDGFLRITNSMMLYNYRDVWGMTWDTWSYRTNQMEIAGNWLSQANPHHLDNELWTPDRDASALARFLAAPGRPVGAGIALRSARIPANLTNVPVRLSTFTTNSVSLEYQVRSKRGPVVETVDSGTLLFHPGQSVANVPLPRQAGEVLQIEIAGGTNVVLTGLTRAYLISNPPPEYRVLVSEGSTWKYPDPVSDFGQAWRAPDFNDTGWRSGPAELGGGDGDETTVINLGQPQRFPTLYFRHLFEHDGADNTGALTARVKVDDGTVIHLNGQEVFRVNMPAGPISYNTLAASTLENQWFTNAIPAAALVPGTNLLAVEVHQRDLDSSDLSFDFELRGVLPLELAAIQLHDRLLLNWVGAGAVLEVAPAVTGPWREIASASELVELPLADERKFFRLKQP